MRSLPILLLVGCTADVDATQALLTTAGLYQLDLTLEPGEPVAGDEVRAVLMVMDGGLTPVSGADVDLVPFMPMHGHGVSDDVVVAEQGDGLYDGSFVFSMPGMWEIGIAVSAEAGDDEAVAVVEVL